MSPIFSFTIGAFGAAASLLTHEATHYLYLKSRGITSKIILGKPVITIRPLSPLSAKEKLWNGRIGMLVQNVVGTLLLSTTSSFAMGFLILSCFEIVTYRLRNRGGGDLHLISAGGGDAKKEHLLLSGWSILNLIVLLIVKVYL